jgi:hypothetical protein
VGENARVREGQRELRNDAKLAVTGDVGLTKARLDAWVVWMRQNGVTPGGCNMYVRPMNSYLAWLYAEGHHPERLRVKLLRTPHLAIETFTRPRPGYSPRRGRRAPTREGRGRLSV